MARVILLLALVFALALAWLRFTPPSTTAYVNGLVLTMDAESHVHQAVLVRGDRIAAVGTSAEIGAASPSARIVDLGGHVVLPGFIDAHGHFPGAGLDAVVVDLASPPVGSIRRIDELLAALRTEAEQTSEGDWVQGFGYDDTLLAEKRHPTREELDHVSAKHPIWILHVSGHLGVANTPALAAAGIGRETRDPAGGVIRRDPRTGEPTGVLEESARWKLQAAVPEFSLLESIRILRRGAERYLASGVTTAQQGLGEKAHIDVLARLSWLGFVPLRLVVWPKREVADEIAAATYAPARWSGPSFRVGAVKLVADGSIQGYTAYLTRPYLTPRAGESAWRG
ncbi:MAG: amidohydrolase, partial [bacterium]